MIKNDINLLQKRKGKQYSSKSVALTIILVGVLGVGIFLGITLPSKNLAQTRAAVAMLDSELQQYSGVALAAAEGTDETESASGVSIDTIYIEKSNTLKNLEEELESLILLSSAKSNALTYINCIEESIPDKANVSSLTLVESELSIYGTAQDDEALAEFTLKLRECGQFKDVFVVSSMVAAPGEKTCVFNMTATLSEPLNSRPVTAGEETSDVVTTSTGGEL